MSIMLRSASRGTKCRECANPFEPRASVVYVGGYGPVHPACAERYLTRQLERATRMARQVKTRIGKKLAALRRLCGSES